MLEALVIFSCLNNIGCAETSGAYYLTRPDIKERVEYYEYRARRIAGETIVTYAVPLVMVASGQEGAVKLTRNVSLKGKSRWQNLDLVYSYSF